jgi:hypothetical protein
MSNPWLKKNPLLSMWLSGANSVANTARAKVAAQARRQSSAAISKTTSDLFALWTGAAPPKRKRKR